MTKASLRSGVIVCSLMTFGTGVSIGQNELMSQEKASSPPISQAGPYVYLIPQSAHSPGDKGSNWRTDAVLHNGGLNEATAWIYYLKADTDNSSAEGTKVTVAAHSSVKLPDLVKNLFGEEKSTGALLVGSDQELVITSRTYNDDANGTFGQYVEGYPVPTAIGANEEVRLIGLAENVNRRTNIGFANGTGKTLDILVVMFKADGTRLGEKTYQTLPYGFTKKDKIISHEFGATNVDNAFAVILSSTPGAKYFAYASVTDNLSNDPVCIIPVTTAKVTTQQPETSLNASPFAAFAHPIDNLRSSVGQAQIPTKAERFGSTDVWERIGPWTTGGDVMAIVMDPTNSKTLYAGLLNWGGFKTTNGGASWKAVGLSGLAVRALAIDPKNPQIIFAGANQGEGGSIFRSSNGGESWEEVTNGLPNPNCPALLTLAIDPTATQTIYAGTAKGVFKSTNGGGLWKAVNYGLSDLYAIALAIDPINPRTLYVGTWGGGVSKTINGGETWSAISTGSQPSRFANAIAIDPTDSKRLYAVFGDIIEGFSGSVYKSTDRGATWSYAGPSGYSIDTVAIDPTQPETLYALSQDGLFTTTNSGQSWNKLDTGTARHCSGTITIDPKDSKTLYVGLGECRGYDTPCGIIKTTDQGSTWVSINSGLKGDDVRSLVIDPSNPQVIYVGTRYHGLFRTTNNGASWTVLNNGFLGKQVPQNVPALAVDPANPQVVYAASDCGVFKSYNGGESWMPINAGLNSSYVNVNILAIDATNPQIIYAGTTGGGVFKSFNGGEWWVPKNNGLVIPVSIEAFAINPENPQIIYAGSPGVAKSIDGGETWTRVTGIVSIYSLTIDPTNPQIIFAGTGSRGVLKSTDGGVAWSFLNGPQPYKTINTIACDPARPQTIIAGTSDGIFVSSNGGKSWAEISTGEPYLNVEVIKIDSMNPKTMYLGTSSGVFRQTLAPCDFTIEHTSANFPRTGGAGTIVVSTGEGCFWTATSNETWISIAEKPNGVGSGTAGYTVEPNPTGGIRSGTISVAGNTFTVIQSNDCGRPTAPTVLSPVTTGSGRTYTLSWSANSGSKTYELQESTNPDFAGAHTQVVIGTSTTVAHLVVSASTFYVRVRAIDVCDGQTYISEWSATAATVVSPVSTIFLPAAAHTQGLADTNWRTDLEVHNPGSIQAEFALALLAKDQNNSNQTIKALSLGSNQSVRYADALQNLFDFSGSATLCIVPLAGSVMATSRTYNLLGAGNKVGLPEGATFGQFIPGKTDTDAIEYGQAGRLVQLSQSLDESTGFRTNIGLSNVVAFPITIEVRLYRGDGTFLAGKTKVLPPFGATQVNTIFKDVITTNMDDGFAEVITITPGGRFFAYASVTDNKSGDPIYIPAVVR